MKLFRGIQGDEDDDLWIPTNVGRYAPINSLDENKWINLDQRLERTVNYIEYVALISQSGTSAPTVNVLNSEADNYMGDFTWTYSSVGSFIGTTTGMNDEFPSKAIAWMSPNTMYISPPTVNWFLPGAFISDANQVSIFVVNGATNVLSNDGLSETTLIIRRYN